VPAIPSVNYSTHVVSILFNVVKENKASGLGMSDGGAMLSPA
jgi:hypothetical protein